MPDPNELLNEEPVADNPDEAVNPEESEQPDESEETPETESETEPEEGKEQEPAEKPAGDDDLLWEEFAKEHGLPDSIKDIDTLVDSYKALLPEMKRLQSREPERHQEPIKPTPQVQQQADEPFLSKTPATDYVSKIVFSDDETKQQTLGTAKFLDSIIGPAHERTTHVLSYLVQENQSLKAGLREMQFGALDERIRKAVKKEQLDELLDKGSARNYHEAAIQHLAFSNPTLINQITQNAEKDGAKKQLKWQNHRRQIAPRSGPSPKPPSGDVSKYIVNGQWDERALKRDKGIDGAIKFLKEHAKD